MVDQRSDYGVVLNVVVQIRVGHVTITASDFGQRHAAVVRWIS